MFTVDDGVTRFSHEQVVIASNAIKDKLRSEAIDPSDTIALLCESTAVSAILLLALLESEQSILIAPPDTSPAHLPGFCRYSLKVAQESGKSECTSALELQENPKWAGSKSRSANTKIYVKTSGSVGASKHVLHDKLKLYQNAINAGKRLMIGPDDRIALPVPIHHMFGLGVGLLPAYKAGASVRLLRQATMPCDTLIWRKSTYQMSRL